MGFQKKTGKGRIDKWYRLAKEKGYRARAAFKLIQLNRKYGFLERSRVILDLCAAPGSWCQVAAENMPAKNSVLIGVDLAPIKPIPKAITIQSDITTDKCRASIRQHLKNWKADAVLHDGAPNVGTAWVQDAFSQAELVLQALKLATDFLAEGGVFVTKIFRSKDYNALLWIFNQLFAKVEATKPPSSRGVSAEIFVVCQGFKAPKNLDPRFLDPKSVFAEVKGPAPNNEAKVFNPDRKKRKREGYDEGDYTQFREIAASEFVQSSDPIAILGSYNRLSFARKGDADIALAALDKLPETTKEIRQCCEDLKVLGRKDFKLLLRWRLQAREIFGFSKPSDTAEGPAPGEEVAEVTTLEVDDVDEELQQLSEKNLARKRRERRRENEKKQREIRRMQLHMTTPSEIGMDLDEGAGDQKFFALKDVEQAGALNKITKARMSLPEHREEQPAERLDEASDVDEDDDLDEELDNMYRQYQDRKAQHDSKYWAKKARKETDSGDFEGFSDEGSLPHDDSDALVYDTGDTESQEDASEHQPLVFPRHDASKDQGGLTRRAALFFEQEIFKGLADAGDGDSHDSAVDLSEDHGIVDKGDSKPRVAENEYADRKRKVSEGKTASDHTEPDVSRKDQPQPSGPSNADANVDENDSASFEVVKSTATDWEKDAEPQRDGRPDIDIITAEAMTLAHQIASGQKTKQDVVDDGFNKYTFRDTDGLPEWFLDDESKHSLPNRPISAAAAAAIKEKLRALNARPIKKVREAKDRKKFKAAQRLEKLRKKSALIAEDDGVSEKDKAANIARMMRRAAKKKPKQQPKLVVAKGGNRGISGRPRGVKGKYKIVDSRLKKDVRAQKRLAKKR